MTEGVQGAVRNMIVLSRTGSSLVYQVLSVPRFFMRGKEETEKLERSSANMELTESDPLIPMYPALSWF